MVQKYNYIQLYSRKDKNYFHCNFSRINKTPNVNKEKNTDVFVDFI